MKTSNHSARDWALEKLGLNGTENLNKSLLTYVEQEGFILNDEEFEAFCSLTERKENTNSSGFKKFKSLQDIQKVKAFKSSFFSFPPALRKEKFNDLRAESGESFECKILLNSLEPGLEIDQNKMPKNNELLDIILEIFTAAPSDKAKIFDSISLMTSEKKKSLNGDYKKLMKKVPEVCTLVPNIDHYFTVQFNVSQPQKKDSVQTYAISLVTVFVLVIIAKIMTTQNNPEPVLLPDNIQMQNIDEIIKKIDLRKNKPEPEDDFLKFLEEQQVKESVPDE